MEVNVFEFYNQKGKEYSFLLLSDAHIGHAYFDNNRFHRDCKSIKRKDGMIFINGDLCDGIISTDLKRFTKSGSKALKNTDNPINQYKKLIIQELLPYVNNIALIGVGNHETKLMKYNGIDIVELVIDELNQHRKKELKPIVHGGYTGFIKIILYNQDENKTYRPSTRAYTIFYNHGQGGAAPVTHGAIDLDRRQHIICDLIWLGHKHKKTLIELPTKIMLDKANKIREKTQRGIITGCYIKNVHQYDIKEGYEIDFGEETQTRPAAQGGVELKLSFRGNRLNSSIVI